MMRHRPITAGGDTIMSSPSTLDIRARSELATNSSISNLARMPSQWSTESRTCSSHSSNSGNISMSQMSTSRSRSFSRSNRSGHFHEPSNMHVDSPRMSYGIDAEGQDEISNPKMDVNKLDRTIPKKESGSTTSGVTDALDHKGGPGNGSELSPGRDDRDRNPGQQTPYFGTSKKDQS